MTEKNKKTLTSLSALPTELPEGASRAVVLLLLNRIFNKKQAFEESIKQEKDFDRLEKRDRAFAHILVATILRRLGQLDDVIKQSLNKPQKLKPEVQNLLRLGAVQLLFLDTPPHAAVNTTVELAAKRSTTMPYKGLINAVLRRLVKDGKQMMAAHEIGRINTPEWLWSAWQKNFGQTAVRTIAEAHLGEALVDLCVKEDPEKWAETLKAELLPTGNLRLSGAEQITSLPGFEEGDWWVQDAAASLPVKMLGDIKGKRVLDLCAAPGGKTMQLAAAGAQVTALDIAQKRLDRLMENMARTGLTCALVQSDALAYKPDEKFDAVLMDAPCSSTGTLRRHPDGMHLKEQKDVDRLADLQAKMLDYAADRFVKDGGVLVYAVCSLQPEEGENQIKEFLKKRTDMKRLPLTPEEIGGEAAFINKDGDLRTRPDFWEERGGIDGFFAARLVKTER